MNQITLKNGVMLLFAFTLCIGTLFLSSCTQELVQPVGTVGNPVTVRLSIAVGDMQPGITVAPSTRGKADSKQVALSVGYTVPDRATRSDAARTDAEKALNSLWMLQFGGTSSGSRLIKKTDITDLLQDNFAEVTFFANNTKNRVYLVANADVIAFTESSTTLQHFEEGIVTFAPCTETELAAKGLPMIASADIDPRTDAPGTLMLQSMVTKLTLQCKVAPGFDCDVQSITLNQVSEKVPVTPLVGGDAATRVPGITENDFTQSLDITSAKDGAIICYFPSNLAGRKTALTEMWERSTNNAPAEKAAFLEIVGTMPDGKSVSYTFFLGDGTAQDFNIESNRHYKLALTLESADDTDLRVESYFDLNPDGRTANCYLIANDADNCYHFDATVMGNGATTEAATQGGTASGARIVPQALSPQSVKVLWETGSVAGAVVSKVRLSADKTKVLFEAGTTAGNAVIAVYDGADGTGNILWSWHIWKPETEVTDFRYQKYVDNTGVVTTADNYRMLDRNLGATTAATGADGALGLMYQWGRKDPFPGAKDKNTDEYMATVPALASGRILSNVQDLSTLSLADNAACLAYAIENPTTFLKGVGGWSKGWIKEKQDNLWGNPWEGGQSVYSSGSTIVNSGVGSKSIYDPCPVGYRVAPQDTWTALQKGDGSTYDDANSQWDDSAKGWSSTSMSPTGSAVFFPASGYVDSGDGYLNYVGYNGFHWASSPCNDSNANAGDFGINHVGGLYPVGGSHRARGGPVRCVAELD